MSEKIYSWLLRLYPAQFREKYGAEALQLFRDRAREETELFAGVRLWFDLLVDLAISLPTEYLHAETEFAGSAALYNTNGVPTFHCLTTESLHPGSLVFGALVSSMAIFAFSILLGHGGRYAGNAYLRPGQYQDGAGLAEQGAPQAGAEATTATATPNPAASGNIFPLDAAERRQVVESAASILKEHYVERENGQKMADALLEHEKNGDDDQITDGRTLAAVLTRQIREVSRDRHLIVEYSEEPLPAQPAAPTPESLLRYETAMRNRNCTFERVTVLPGHIGYLKFNSFPDVSVCRKTAEDAMDSLNSTRAIIFDLRDNRGGDPAMVMLLAAYLFDHPEYMYNPRENTTEQSWTHSPVPGNKLADKPAYILTSVSTASAAEHFSYDLKMLKRATIVGERTAGAAHSGEWHRIDEHFGMGVPETKAINPFSTEDWAEVGVEADVQVKAEDALETAARLARGTQRKR